MGGVQPGNEKADPDGDREGARRGVVEKRKPALEQGCTPPPSEEDKKNAYLNCLCRCSSGWAGHIGVWYDPEGKSEPECKSSGPCFGGAGAFGCTRRHFFVGPNDCGKGCWEAAFGKDTYDPKKADELRKNENKKYKKPLTAKITPSKNPADFGDIITLQAEASEGSGGYSYQWGGCAQDAKDAQAKVANTRDCKPCAASVTVTDQDGDSASATVAIQCNTVKVKLTKESPKENTVPVGGKATLLRRGLFRRQAVQRPHPFLCLGAQSGRDLRRSEEPPVRDIGRVSDEKHGHLQEGRNDACMGDRNEGNRRQESHHWRIGTDPDHRCEPRTEHQGGA